MLNTFPSNIGVLSASAKSTPSSIFRIDQPLDLKETIIFSYSANSPLCPWVRWFHDNNRGAG